MSRQHRIGAEGEKRAQLYLRRKGYAIRETNWSSIFGELDIIAEKQGVLVFVEVKARRGADTEAALAGSHRRQTRADDQGGVSVS